MNKWMKNERTEYPRTGEIYKKSTRNLSEDFLKHEALEVGLSTEL
jgi:hypothetical protein